MDFLFNILPTLAIFLATLIWGTTLAFIKDAVSTISPYDFIFWRFTIASLIIIVVFKACINLSKQNLFYGTILGFFLGATVIFQSIGLQYTSASMTSFITSLSVLFVNFFDYFVNKSQPSFYLMCSAVLTVCGVAFITLSSGLTINPGDIWVLLCAVSLAGYILWAEKSSNLQQPFSLTFIQSLVVCLISASMSGITKNFHIPTKPNVWVAILFCSIFASIIAFWLQLKFQKSISATKAAIIFSLEPVFATITAAFYLHEHLTYAFFIGASLILSAIFLSEKQAKNTIVPEN